jgi:bacterioferritin-associated ferredoxin
MYICLCKAITDKQLQEQVEKGVKFEDACSSLGVGSDCGICMQEAWQKCGGELSISAQKPKVQKKSTKF